MKQKQNVMKLLFGATMVLLAACSNDDDPKETIPTDLPAVVNKAFKAQFPQAKNVKWTKKNTYHVASFDLVSKTRAAADAGNVNEAWYTPAGNCGLSELEISSAELEKNYAPVLAAWKKTVYPKEGYIIDDIDLLQRSAAATDQVVKIEIEKGDLERELYFTLGGILAKDAPSTDDDENLPCPPELTTYVNTHYSGAVIVDFEQDAATKTCEVEILMTQAGISLERELTFSDQYKFIKSEIDIEDSMLATLLKQILTAEQLDKVATIAGEKDPLEWNIQLTENEAGDLTLSIENTEGNMQVIAVLDKNLKPKEVMPVYVPQAVSKAFQAQFPNATNVKWKEKKNYHVASFDLASKTRAAADAGNVNEAWYTETGTCGLSELEVSQAELEKSYAPVFAAWKKTVYPKEGYVIDDIDLLQRSAAATDQVVKIEIEKGDLERELYFTLGGILAKDVVSTDDKDEDENLPCPQELTDYVNQHQAGAVIVDFEQDTTAKTYEVEILLTQAGILLEKELTFNDQYAFISAEIDIEDEVLVTLLKKMLTAEQLAAIAKITGEEDPAEWEIEITENGAGDITLSVENTEGKMQVIATLDKNFQPKK